jgi:hypothetical protein
MSVPRTYPEISSSLIAIRDPSRQLRQKTLFGDPITKEQEYAEVVRALEVELVQAGIEDGAYVTSSLEYEVVEFSETETTLQVNFTGYEVS